MTRRFAVRQQFSYVETYAAGTDNGNAFADRDTALDHVHVAGDLGVADAVDHGLARYYAACQNDMIETSATEFFGGDAMIQPQRNPGNFEPAPEVTQGFIEFLFAWNFFCVIELAADFGRGV